MLVSKCHFHYMTNKNDVTWRCSMTTPIMAVEIGAAFGEGRVGWELRTIWHSENWNRHGEPYLGFCFSSSLFISQAIYVPPPISPAHLFLPLLSSLCNCSIFISQSHTFAAVRELLTIEHVCLLFSLYCFSVDFFFSHSNWWREDVEWCHG